MSVSVRTNAAFRLALPAGLLLSLSFLTGCTQQEPQPMSPEALYALIQSEEPILILDVRTAGEYRRGHVPGALHRPFYKLMGANPEVAAAADSPLLVYCEHGPRAGMAAWGLRRSGFTDIRYLEGNMAAWRKRSLPVEAGADASDEGD